MAIVDMSRITLVGSRGEQAGVLAALTRNGAVDVRMDEEAADRLAASTGSSAELLRSISDLQAEMTRLDDLIKLCADRLHIKKPLFTTRRIVRPETVRDAGRRREEILAQADAIDEALRQEQRIEDRLSALETSLKILGPWRELVLPPQIEAGSSASQRGRTGTRTGSMPDDEALSELHGAFGDAEIPLASDIFFRTEEAVAVTLAYPASVARTADRLIAQSRFAALPARTAEEKRGDYPAAWQATHHEIKQLTQEAEMLDAKVRELAAVRKDLQLLHDWDMLELSQLEARTRLIELPHLYCLRGWIPTAAQQDLNTALEPYTVAVEYREPEADESPPSLLHTPKFFRPYESVIETFSMPKYGEDVDPTIVMAHGYAFFFGMMLGDVGYGLLFAILLLIVLFKFKVEGNMRRMCTIFLHGSVISIVFGFLFGGFFGDLLTQVSSGAVSFPTLWFNPMEEPIKMMIWSMVFGVLHLFAGVILNMYNKIRHGEVKAALGGDLSWLLIISGIGLLLVDVTVGRINPGLVLIVIGVALVFLFGSESRNPFVKLFSGLGDLYGVTGWLSDILSYTRVLALALATSVIAMVVNIMAMMVGFRGINVIFFILIMAAGHALNLALSGLSAYVHTTRLQYVEFFGKFYGGGGDPFIPLEVSSKYTRQPATQAEMRELATQEE